MGNIGSHVNITSGATRHQAFPVWIRRPAGAGYLASLRALD
jgi:hypothetical protein